MALTAFQKRVKNALKNAKTTKKNKSKSKKKANKTVGAASFRKMLHEQKYYDAPDVAAQLVANDVPATTTVRHLDVIVQNAGVNNRIGKNYKLKSCHIRGHISSNAATEASPYRLSLVYDASPNKLQATHADIFQSLNAHSLPNRNNETRFTVLHTWYDSVKGTFTASDALQKLVLIDRYIDLSSKGLYVMCTDGDTLGVIGARVAGALYLVAMSNETTASNKAPYLTYQCRIEFDDA